MSIRAKKSLGQNFLSNRNILEKIAGAAGLTKGDTVLEVGPGTGNLTAVLAEKAGRVVAIEKDHRLIELLHEKFPDTQHVQIIEDDVLEFDPTKSDLRAGQYAIVANLPYYITSHFIRMVFERWPVPSVIVLTVQKEVAQRIIATPPHMNLLALSVQFYADAKIIAPIPRGSFTPMPNVDSAIIKLTPHAPRLEGSAREQFFSMLHRAFSGKRKQLVNTLEIPKEALKASLESLDLPPTARPEELSLEQWLALARLVS